MMLACTRALSLCAALALPTSAFAQSPRSPTIFSPSSQMGTVVVRAAVVRTDYVVKPLPLLTIVARRTDRADSVVAQTDLDGRASMPLSVGTYTLRAKTSPPIDGRSYAWSVQVIVRSQRIESVQLTNANASSADGGAVGSVALNAPSPAPAQVVVSQKTSPPTSVAAASPKSAAPERSVAARDARIEKPAVDRPAPTAEQKVVVTADSARTTAPASANPFVAAGPPARRVRVAPAPPRANTSRLLLGLAFDASAIKSQDLSRSTESGAGVAGQLGWGFTKNFAMIVDASAARISSLDGDFDLAHVDVGGRWHFVSRSSGFVPFVDVGYAGRAVIKNDALLSNGSGTPYTGNVKVLGGGVSLGGGFQYFPVPKMAIGGAFKWTTGKFTRVQVDNVTVDGFSMDATSARFNMGFTWFPMAR